jgi:hypothetical protein
VDLKNFERSRSGNILSYAQNCKKKQYFNKDYPWFYEVASDLIRSLHEDLLTRGTVKKDVKSSYADTEKASRPQCGYGLYGLLKKKFSTSQADHMSEV